MKKTILLAEDNQDNRDLIRYILDAADFDVELYEVENGEDAVRLADEKIPDLILMDLKMPVMDGWLATQIIKSNSKLSAIPIIALTAQAMKGDRAKALEAGCDDYIAKPLEREEFLEKIQQYLSFQK
jgi:CheY-like chemotaxis protein